MIKQHSLLELGGCALVEGMATITTSFTKQLWYQPLLKLLGVQHQSKDT